MFKLGELLKHDGNGPMPNRRPLLFAAGAFATVTALGACAGEPPGSIVPLNPEGISEGLKPDQVVWYLRRDFMNRMTGAGQSYPDYTDLSINSPDGSTTKYKMHLYGKQADLRLLVRADTALSEVPQGVLLYKPVIPTAAYASWFNSQMQLLRLTEPGFYQQITKIETGFPQLFNYEAGTFAIPITFNGVDQVFVHPVGIPYPFAATQGINASAQSLGSLTARSSVVHFLNVGRVGAVESTQHGLTMLPMSADQVLVVAGSAKTNPVLALLDGAASDVAVQATTGANAYYDPKAIIRYLDGTGDELAAYAALRVARTFKGKVGIGYSTEELEEIARGYLRGRGLRGSISYASILLLPVTLGVRTNNIKSLIENISDDTARRLATDWTGANARMCQEIAESPPNDEEGNQITLIIPFNTLKADLAERTSVESMAYTQEFTFPDGKVAECNLPAAAIAVAQDEQGAEHFAVRFYLSPGQQADISGEDGSVRLIGPSGDTPIEIARQQIQWLVPNKPGEYHVYLPSPDDPNQMTTKRYLYKVNVVLGENGAPEALVFNFLGTVYPA